MEERLELGRLNPQMEKPLCPGNSACLLYTFEQGGGLLHIADQEAGLHTDKRGGGLLYTLEQ